MGKNPSGQEGRIRILQRQSLRKNAREASCGLLRVLQSAWSRPREPPVWPLRTLVYKFLFCRNRLYTGPTTETLEKRRPRSP